MNQKGLMLTMSFQQDLNPTKRRNKRGKRSLREKHMLKPKMCIISSHTEPMKFRPTKIFSDGIIQGKILMKILHMIFSVSYRSIKKMTDGIANATNFRTI